MFGWCLMSSQKKLFLHLKIGPKVTFSPKSLLTFLTSPVLTCWTEWSLQIWLGVLNICGQNKNHSQNKNGRFFDFLNWLTPNRIMTRFRQITISMLANTTCLGESQETCKCSCWKKFDCLQSNHAIRSRLIIISMLANTRRVGNWDEAWKCNLGRNSSNCSKKQQWWNRLKSCWCSTQKLESVSST